MNSVMYVVKNDKGEYLTFQEMKWVFWPNKYAMNLFAPENLEDALFLTKHYGGQVYQVQLTISDTPVQEN